jgi:ABC-type multidrug transport system fused ATPase/permease subunit
MELKKLGKNTFYQGLKIIKERLTAYKKELVVLTVLALASAGTNALQPYLFGKLLDNLSSPVKNFFTILVIWLFISAAAAFIDRKSGVKRECLSAMVEADYLIRAYSKILEMPLSFHKKHKMGSTMHKINRAAYSLEPLIGRVLINLTPAFLTIIIALVICFNVNYKLSAILLLAVVSYGIVLVKTARPLGKLATKWHQALDKVHGYAYDAVLNVQTVKQAIAEKYEQKRFHKCFHYSVIKLRGKLVTIWNNLNFYQRLIIIFTQLVILSASLFLIKKGEMTIGELVMFNSYSLMLFGPFFTLGNYWQLIQNGLIALVQAEKIIGLPSEVYQPRKAIVLSSLKGNIKFKNVAFWYGKNEKEKEGVLKDINFSIKAGEKIALVGKSGVGKSTLVDLISGYYFPKRGKIFIDGYETKKLNLKSLRHKIALVPQEIILFNDTIENNIKYGSFGASEKAVKEAAKLAYADEFIKNFPQKYNQLVGERGIKLSVGQKQRIAIARAILRNPKILILDEPTSNLDAHSEKHIEESLERLMSGRTTIIIAHRLRTVKKANKILVLHKGRIVEQGTHEELIKIKNGVYRRLCELQTGLK